MTDTMKKKMLWVFTAILVCGASLFASCSNNDDDKGIPEVTLENALYEGTIVTLTFNLNGVDYDVNFLRTGDTFLLIDPNASRAAENTLSEKDFNFTMEHDKDKGLITFIVKEKKTSNHVLTAFIDIKQSTLEVVPGDSQIQVTGFKMKISNVEITKLLKDRTDEVTLADALVKGAKVEIAYKWNGNSTTVFTFINEGGKFSSKISGNDAGDFEGSLNVNGNKLEFSGKNWNDYDCTLELHFSVVENTFRFWTVNHQYYTSHTVSVNGTDITSKLTEDRAL